MLAGIRKAGIVLVAATSVAFSGLTHAQDSGGQWTPYTISLRCSGLLLAVARAGEIQDPSVLPAGFVELVKDKGAKLGRAAVAISPEGAEITIGRIADIVNGELSGNGGPSIRGMGLEEEIAFCSRFSDELPG